MIIKKEREHQAEFSVLLVEDNAAEIRLLYEIMEECRIELNFARTLKEALEQLKEKKFDVILLDLKLPDSHGLDTVTHVYREAPDIPIVVLTNNDDESMGIKAVQHGTQDYLIKGELNENTLERSMRYAIERHRLLVQLQNMSIIDELTGIYNRRGFFAMAEQQLRVAERTESERNLLYVDIDNMKKINDTFGHNGGDRALINTAALLQKTFRDSDIIGRIGGDEFTVLLSSGIHNESPIIRLQENLVTHNSLVDKVDKVHISAGLACYSKNSKMSIGELVSRADSLMYEQKRNKKNMGVDSN